jgi:PTS system glucitol/sorbitol-specific IIC component
LACSRTSIPANISSGAGILVALLELEKKGAVPTGYHINVAIWYALVGLVVILLKGMLTERITAIMARRQGIEL